MYQVFADDILIYDDTRQETTLKLVNPKLSISDSAAGSFTMTVPLNNPGYYAIQRMLTTIHILQEGKQIWEGRVIQESIDFHNQRRLTCEGELAYLNDVTLTQHVYNYGNGNKVRMFLVDIINQYNALAREDRQFAVGDVDVDPFDISDSGGTSVVLTFTRTTNYETVIECINNQLLNRLGGHIRVRHATESGHDIRYIDYVKDNRTPNSQVIRFGKNLIDFTKSYDSTQFATVIIPLGAKLKEDEIPSGESQVGDIEYYLTAKSAVADAYHEANSIYLVSESAVEDFGRIEKVIHFDDVKNADQVNQLVMLGEKYLTDTQFDTMSIELTAFDLHYLNPLMDSVKIGDYIRVVSEPHGMDRYFAVTKLEILLDQPENTRFTLGGEVRTSLTAISNKLNSEIQEKIETIPDAKVDTSGILAQAQTNAVSAINARTNGYVTIETNTTGGIHSQALYVSETNPKGQKYWVWNSNGLAYTNNGGSTYTTAITMNGTILGNMIAAESIVGSSIAAGTITADKIDVTNLKVKEVFYEDSSILKGYMSGSTLQVRLGAESGFDYTSVLFYGRWFQFGYMDYYGDMYGGMVTFQIYPDGDTSNPYATFNDMDVRISTGRRLFLSSYSYLYADSNDDLYWAKWDGSGWINYKLNT